MQRGLAHPIRWNFLISLEEEGILPADSLQTRTATLAPESPAFQSHLADCGFASLHKNMSQVLKINLSWIRQSCLAFHKLIWLFIDYAANSFCSSLRDCGALLWALGLFLQPPAQQPLLHSNHGLWVELPSLCILGPHLLCRAIGFLRIHQLKCKSHPEALSQKHPK